METSFVDLLRSSVGAAMNQAGADPAAAVAKQQALLASFQTRVQRLTDAKVQIVAQYDAEIAQLQQRIGAVQQVIEEAANAPAAPPADAVPAQDQPLDAGARAADTAAPGNSSGAASATPSKRSGKGAGAKKSS
jgi:hypothetical protein